VLDKHGSTGGERRTEGRCFTQDVLVAPSGDGGPVVDDIAQHDEESRKDADRPCQLAQTLTARTVAQCPSRAPPLRMAGPVWPCRMQERTRAQDTGEIRVIRCFGSLALVGVGDLNPFSVHGLDGGNGIPSMPGQK
jgi:hypothetical protein